MGIRQKITASPDRYVLFWLCVWLIVNVIQAAFTGLADDEAYYVMFAENPAWGYFDHPPVTAMLVWLGTHICGGSLGVRLAFLLLQPAYLWILWRLIKPEDGKADLRDARLYTVLTAATLMLQLYGFVAVPDSPLMFTAALFLLAFDRFCKGGRFSWVMLGLTMALMAYSKYHGALVVLFCVAANPRLLRRPGLYLAGLLTFVLLIPHLMWQYSHNWASFAYHLSDRNALFELSYVTDFVANMLVVFNPLFVPVFFQAWKHCKAESGLTRALRWLPVLFIGFFLLSSLRGYVQPQWVIASIFGTIYVMFRYVRRHPRTYRYVMRSGMVTIGLVLLCRIVMITNPFNIKFQIFHNEASYGQLAEIAAGRPIIFNGNYAIASKYRYYTGCPAYCEPEITYRTHQWQFRDDDSAFEGQEVLVMCNRSDVHLLAGVDSVRLKNNETFRWFVDRDFRPVRLVDVSAEGLPAKAVPGDSMRLSLTLTNPYGRDVLIDSTQSLVMVWKYSRFDVIEYTVCRDALIPAGGSIQLTIDFTVPEELADRVYKVGFALKRTGYIYWFNGQPAKVKVTGR